jgi:CheY-like chemotaxis protein
MRGFPTIPTIKILVVDDNTADTDLLRIALDEQHEEYELQVLATGEEALRFIREHKNGCHAGDPCVIILDLHLPRYDGISILQAVRETPVLDRIKVVVLSGSASPQERHEIAAMGALYRQKPFTLEEFLALGAEIFALCKSPASAAA